MMHCMVARFVTGLLSAMVLCLTASCSGQQTVEFEKETQVTPFTPPGMLQSELDLNPGPTLVEFVQNFNCARCDQMDPTIADLRAGFGKEVTFHRVSYLAAADSFHLVICPTYMFVLDGQVIGHLSGIQPYPILASRLDDLVASHQLRAGESRQSFQENENESK